MADKTPTTTQPDEQESFDSGRDRYASISECGLDPATLVGSWFHKLENGDMVWQGLVVGEPQPGRYLLHIDKLDIGAENVQILAKLDSMLFSDEGYEWRFYDTQEKAALAFVAWETSARERA